MQLALRGSGVLDRVQAHREVAHVLSAVGEERDLPVHLQTLRLE
jgi:hypothetical protein